MARQYYSIGEMCVILQKLLKAMKFSFSAEGKHSNLKLLDYIPSEGEIFKELEPVVTEMIATGEAERRIGPVIIYLKNDDEKTYNFKIDFALGTMFFLKEDLVKTKQGSFLEGFEGLVGAIKDIDVGEDEEIEREELIDEAEGIGVIWIKPLDEYENHEIRDAIATRRLSISNEKKQGPKTIERPFFSEEELQEQRKRDLLDEVVMKRNLAIDPARDYCVEELEAMIEADEELTKKALEEEPTACHGPDPDETPNPCEYADKYLAEGCLCEFPGDFEKCVHKQRIAQLIRDERVRLYKQAEELGLDASSFASMSDKEIRQEIESARKADEEGDDGASSE